MTGIVANLRAGDLDAAKGFYQGYLSTEEFNMGWGGKYTSPDGITSIFVRAPDGNVINMASHADK